LSDGPIKSRRAARVAAFQALYQCVSGGSSIDRAVSEALERQTFVPEVASMVRDLAVGAMTGVSDLDARYAPFLKSGWSPDRLALVDRLVLRLAVFELWSLPNVPPLTTITEYVELARKFGSAESSGFIHAVLGKTMDVSPKKEWTGQEPEQEQGTEPEIEQEQDLEPESDVEREQEAGWTIKSGEAPL
jgi:N utilization substance protein B